MWQPPHGVGSYHNSVQTTIIGREPGVGEHERREHNVELPLSFPFLGLGDHLLSVAALFSLASPLHASSTD